MAAKKSRKSAFSPEAIEKIVRQKTSGVDLRPEISEAYLAYAQSANKRSIPDVRDGLKPVYRRILYTMMQNGSTPTGALSKTMKFIGDTMGAYHPHGDAGISDAFTTITFPTDKQPMRFNLPLIQGQGNWGNLVDGPAAPRYTECRLDYTGQALLGILPGETKSEVSEDAVEMIATYDGRKMEPVVLPSLYPGFLVNNIEGIGTPVKTQTPSHNFVEVMNLAIKMVDVHSPTWETVKKIMPGPDMPCDCDIFIETEDGIPAYYESGKGSFVMRARYDINEADGEVVVSGLPYQVSSEAFVAGVQSMIEDGSLNPKIEVLDTSTDGVNVVIVLNGCDPQDTMNRIVADRRTKAQVSLSVSAYAHLNGRYKRFGVLEAMREWLKHRKQVIRNRSEYRKAKAQDRLHIVNGYIQTVPVAEDIIAIARECDTKHDAAQKMMDKWGFSEAQSEAILSMSIAQITKMSMGKYVDEKTKLEGIIDETTKLLTDKEYRNEQLKAEIRATRDHIKSKSNVQRRCTIRYESSRVVKPQAPAVEIPEVKMTLSVSPSMWVRVGKRPPRVMSISNDYFTTNIPMTDAFTLEVFTNKGAHHRVPVADLPDGKPIKIDSMLPSLGTDQKVVGISVSHDGNDGYQPDVILVTNDGLAKRVPYSSYSHNKKRVANMLPLSHTQEIVAVCPVVKGGTVTLVDSCGKAVFMPEDKLNAKKSLSAAPLPVMKMTGGAHVVWAGMTNFDQSLAVIQKAVNGVKSVFVCSMADQPTHNRNVKGIGILPTTTATVSSVFLLNNGVTHLLMTNGFDTPVDIDLSDPSVTPGVDVMNKKTKVFTHEVIYSDNLIAWGESREPDVPDSAI